MHKFLIVLMLTALILCGCSSGSDNTLPTVGSTTTDPSETTAPSETSATAAPDFVMYDKGGNPVHLSDFQGKPVILNFWASWCGPCKSEMPDLEEAWQEYGEQIHFVMVDLTDGSKETVETASAYIKNQGYTFPVYYDIEMDGANTYGISSIPITFFIDENGEMLAYYSGAMSETVLRAGITLLLQEEE